MPRARKSAHELRNTKAQVDRDRIGRQARHSAVRNEGATSDGDHRVPPRRRLAQKLELNATEKVLTLLQENVRHLHPVTVFQYRVQIVKSVPNLGRHEPPDSTLPSPHETGNVN